MERGEREIEIIHVYLHHVIAVAYHPYEDKRYLPIRFNVLDSDQPEEKAHTHTQSKFVSLSIS